MKKHAAHTVDIAVKLFAESRDLIIAFGIDLGCEITAGKVSDLACNAGNRIKVFPYCYEEEASEKCKKDNGNDKTEIQGSDGPVHNEAVRSCTYNNP